MAEAEYYSDLESGKETKVMTLDSDSEDDIPYPRIIKKFKSAPHPDASTSYFSPSRSQFGSTTMLSNNGCKDASTQTNYVD